MGSKRDSGRRAGDRDTSRVRTDLRQAVARGFIRARSAAPVPDFTPLRHRSAAATGIAAKNTAQYRRTGFATRSRAGFMENRQTVAGTLDERADWMARVY